MEEEREKGRAGGKVVETEREGGICITYAYMSSLSRMCVSDSRLS